MKIPNWYKTNTKEVFDYIAKYERSQRKLTGKVGFLPTPTMIGLVFDITKQRGGQYLKKFKKKYNK